MQKVTFRDGAFHRLISILVLIIATSVTLFSQEIDETKIRDLKYLTNATQIGDVDPIYHYLIGRLYVELDSVEAAIRHYDEIKLRDQDYAASLRLVILNHPRGPENLYPDFPFKEGLSNVAKYISSLGTFKNYKLVGKQAAWGCFVNSEGVVLTPSDYYSDMDKAIIARITFDSITDNTDKDEVPDDQPERVWEAEYYAALVIETVTKDIDDQYIAFNSDYEIGNLKRLEFDEIDYAPGDSVFVIQRPTSHKMQLTVGVIKAVREDPILFKIIEIETDSKLNEDAGLVATASGEFLGFITDERIRGSNQLFVFPVDDCRKFACKTRLSLEQFCEMHDSTKAKHKQNKEFYTRLEDGIGQSRLGNYEQALEIFSQLISAGTENSLVYLYAGFCNMKLENYDAAKENYELALQYNDILDEADYQMAEMYMGLDKPKDAIGAFEKCCGINGDNVYYQYLLTKTVKEHGKKRAFKKELAKLNRMDKELAKTLED